MKPVVAVPDKPPVRSPLPPISDLLKQFKRIIDPVGLRAGWTTSRIGIYDDGTIVPILTVLAQEKFGAFDTVHFYPYWKDKTWFNEVWDNVDLVERALGHAKKPNPYGVPAGTKEYWKAYRTANREKVAAYHKKARDKHTEVIEAMREEEMEIVRRLLLPTAGDTDYEPS